MATLPTYEYAGAQYADLPKISTAPQQAAASGWSVLGQQLDKMANYFYGEAASEAQKAGAKFAIEMPPTPEQLEIAKQTGQMPKIEGGGRYFQEAYNKTSAHLLGTDILTNFQNRQTDRLKRIESGEPVNLDQLRRDIRDDIDGSTTALATLDPTTAISFRAQMATVGHAAYKQALTFDEKARQAAYQVDMATSLSKLTPVMENVVVEYAKSGAFSDEQIEMILTGMIEPYTNATSIRMAGGNKFALDAWKIKEEAKKSAIIGKLTDREFAPTAGDAFKKLMAGDAGELSGIYKGMSVDDKKSIRETMIKSFADEEQVRRITEANDKHEKDQRKHQLSLKYLTAPGPEKRKIINTLVGDGSITLQQAEDLLKPKDPPSNPRLFGDLFFQIQRGQLATFDQLLPYANNMSKSEFESLTRATADQQSRQALQRIDREAGITSAYVDPGPVRNGVKIKLTDKWLDVMKRKVKDPETGVMTYPSATQAVEIAIQEYKGDAAEQKKVSGRESAEKQIKSVFDSDDFKRRGIKLPDLPTEKIDFNQIKGLSNSEKERLKKTQKLYTDNI